MSRLHVVEVGAGRPVVALHGFGPDHRSMAGLLEPVFAHVDGYRRVYPDLPGFGRSPNLSVGSTAGMVEVLDAELDELVGAEAFLLVGESYGGYLAAALARRRAGQVLGLALVCPLVVPAFSDRDVPAFQVLVRDPDDSAGQESAGQESAGQELAQRVRFETSLVVQTRQTRARFADEVAAGLEVADPVTAARLHASGLALPNSPYSCEPFGCPALIVTGRQDAIVGYRDQLQVFEQFSRATFVVLDGAGHHPGLERPALVVSLLGDWLRRVEDA